jgi:hypothetical protein
MLPATEAVNAHVAPFATAAVFGEMSTTTLAGAGAAATSTVAVAVDEPAALTAESVKVVDIDGVTTALCALETVTPGSMRTEVAPVTDQLRVLDSPGRMTAGLAAKLATTGGDVLRAAPARQAPKSRTQIEIGIE